jgi:hypothetical protein
VRGDRSVRGHIERSMCTRRTVGGGKHPGLRTTVLLRGRAASRGSRSVAAFGREDTPALAPSAPMTTGARGELRRGIRASFQEARILRSVPRPTLPGPPVGGVARRRRGGWLGFISGSPSPHGKKRTRGGLTRARGSRSVGLVPREGRVTTATKREEGCGPRHAAKIEARGRARTSLFHRLQKSIGDHCRPHRSFSTGREAGLTARWAGSERGPSPRRRTLLTREKSWTEAEPRVKQASRDAGSMRGCAHRGQRIQARVGSTAAHEGRAKPGSRHGGPSA